MICFKTILLVTLHICLGDKLWEIEAESKRKLKKLKHAEQAADHSDSELEQKLAQGFRRRKFTKRLQAIAVAQWRVMQGKGG